VSEILSILGHYRRQIVFFLLLISFLFLIIYPFWLINKKGKVKGAKTIAVEVSGAVNKPGLYTLDSQSRVEDALQKAGGINQKADKKFVAEVLNRARFLQDGEKIFIPFEKELETKTTAKSNEQKAENSQPKTTKSASININKASQKELESLPGIGPVYAQRIIEYRQSRGPFKSKEEIKEVKGIGEKTFSKIKDLISI